MPFQSAIKTALFHLVLCVFAAWSAGTPADGEKPPDQVFDQSAFEVGFGIPAAFVPQGKDRRYLQTDVGKASYRDFSWKHEDDLIVIRQFVVPEITWQQKSRSQMFVDAKRNILAAPENKLVSERDYDIGGCSAHSFIFAVEGDHPKFERMDYILTKPD